MKDVRSRCARLTLPTLVLLAVATLGACSHLPHVPGPVIDGFPVGASRGCEPERSPDCVAIADMALEAFDLRDPGHPDVVSASVHSEDRTGLGDGNGAPVTRSGILWVVVFDLVDGTRRAIGVYCGVPPCWPIPHYKR